MVHCPGWGRRQEVYVHKSVAEPSALEEGDLVAFQIHVNKRGQPQASAPFWKKVGWSPRGKPVDFGKYQGLVARILPNGCAFLDCREISEAYQRDAYVHRVVMRQCDLIEGNFISFNIHVSALGNPQVSAPCWICCSDDKWVKDIVPSALPSRWQKRGCTGRPARGYEGAGREPGERPRKDGAGTSSPEVRAQRWQSRSPANEESWPPSAGGPG